MAADLAFLLERADAALADYFSRDDVRTWVAFAARFHRYSARNLALILSQRPDATRVAGYRAWQAAGRQVRRGETGIRILYPRLRKVADAAGDDLGADARSALVGFSVGTVFDISQTDGPEPPRLVFGPVRGSDAAAKALLAELLALAAALGLRVRFDLDDPRARGLLAGQVIRIRPDLAPAATAKTLAHELAHAVDPRLFDRASADAELVAELAAMIVCAWGGLDSSAYSAPYLATWARDLDRLHATTGAAHAVAAAMINALEAAAALAAAA